MSSKKKIIIGIIIMIVIVIVIGVVSFIQSIEADKKEVEQNMVVITEQYDLFNKYAEEFNTKSTALQQSMQEEMYYTTLVQKNPTIVKALDEIDVIVGKVLEIEKVLKDKCKVYYKDAEINQKCQSYNVSIENMKTVFSEAVENYNKIINSYNEWTTKQGSTTYQKLTVYQAKNLNA